MNDSNPTNNDEPTADTEPEPISDGSGDPNRDRADQMHQAPAKVDEQAVQENPSE